MPFRHNPGRLCPKFTHEAPDLIAIKQGNGSNLLITQPNFSAAGLLLQNTQHSRLHRLPIKPSIATSISRCGHLPVNPGSQSPVRSPAASSPIKVAELPLHLRHDFTGLYL